MASERIRSISAKAASAVSRAEAIIRSASRRALTSALSSLSSSSTRSLALSLRFSSASRSLLSASALSRSRAWRTSSSFSIVASKLALSDADAAPGVVDYLRGTPSRSLIAKALDLPGMPTSRR